jgi:hypothetical protein
MGLAADAAEALIEFRKKRDAEDLTEKDSMYLWQETRETIQQLFLNEEWELSDRTVQEEVREALGPLQGPPDDEELEGYFEQVIRELRTESIFTAYIYFPQLVEVPVGTEIGSLVFIEEETVQERVMDHIEYLFNENEYTARLVEGRNWAKFDFASYKRRAFIRDELIEQLSAILGILEICVGGISSPENLAGGITNNDGTTWYLEPSTGVSGWTRYVEEVAEPTLSELSEMVAKSTNKRTPLEKNILSSVRLLTLQGRDYRNVHSFLTLVAALEGLLLTKYESPKGGKMAEKAAQLLYSDERYQSPEQPPFTLDDKISYYYKVKGWYDIRSEIIHGGYESIDRDKVEDVRWAVKQVVREVVKLADEYYSIQKQGGANNPHKGLNEMFLSKRLSISRSQNSSN